MKKGILISGIITAVAWSITALILAIVGIIYLTTNIMAEGDAGAIDTPELKIAAIVLLAVAGYLLLGMIFSIILIKKRNSNMGKGAGIALGIFGIIFSAEVPGILFIVDSAQHRN